MYARAPSSPRNRCELVRLSFWKPEPLPPKDATIFPVELLSLGRLNTVIGKLLEIPRMAHIERAPWEAPLSESINLMWQIEEGVILRVRTEQGPPKPGEVLTIEAQSQTSEKTFFKLYVQIFEQFGATVLDERMHEFLTPKEFRVRMAG